MEHDDNASRFVLAVRLMFSDSSYAQAAADDIARAARGSIASEYVIDEV